ncbi:MAG: glycosyltransferase [Candidatus Sumerlaeaceae bacterium]|nr:glycosyltransferase [Candidatus Sumerlaeaceae bacterium]
MRVAIDGQTFLTNDARLGIGVYLRELASRLPRLSNEHYRLMLWGPSGGLVPQEDVIPSTRLVATTASGHYGGGDPLHSRNYAVRQFVREWSADIVLNPNPLELHVAPISRPGRVPLIATAHDLTPLFLAGADCLEDLPPADPYRLRLDHLRRNASHLIAVSMASKTELVDKLGFPEERITVIYQGVSERDADGIEMDPRNTEITPLVGFGEKYFLVVGGYGPKKNLENLIPALGRIAPDRLAAHPIVFAGLYDDTSWERLEHLRARHCPSAKFLRLGYVSEGQLAVLYRNAGALLFVSLHEGFGLPIVEAMKQGCPVVTSNRGATAEVAGDAALLCAPDSRSSIADAVREIMERPGLRTDLKRRGLRQAEKFSWDRCAEETADLLRKVGRDHHQPSQSSIKPRIAWFSPLPPEWGGVSAYTEGMCSELRKHFDLTLVNSYPPSAESPEGLKDLPRITHREFRDRTADLLPVYNVQNNFEQSGLTYDTLRQIPGLCIAHDLNIHAFLYDRFVDRNPTPPTRMLRRAFNNDHGENDYYRELNAAHGEAGAAQAYEVLNFGSLPDTSRLPCHRLVTMSSLAVVTHSRWAVGQLESNADPAPIYYLPLGIEVPLEAPGSQVAALRKRLGIENGELLVVTGGFLIPERRLDALLKAIWMLKKQGVRCHLVAAGRTPAWLDTELVELAEKLGLQGQFHRLGYLTNHQDFWTALQAADVVAHLHHPTKGETSSTALRALAAGRPLLVTDEDAFREMPEDCCWKVPAGALEVPTLAEFLGALAADPGLRRTMSRNATAFIHRCHVWPKVAAQFAAIVDEVSRLPR